MNAPRERRAQERHEAAAHERAGAYTTLLVERRDAFWSITLKHPEARNSIDEQLLVELHAALDAIEADPSAKVLVLRGEPPVFCTGLDLRAATASDAARATLTSRTMALMKRLTSISKIVVALVDGDVMAGGIGLVAASDFVFATERSTFALPEALWGLLPAMVLPFLIRRIGFGNAYAMTASADTIDAEAARAMRLVDEVIAADRDPVGVVEKKARRFERLDTRTIGAMKAYFRSLAGAGDIEAIERRAVSEIDRLLSDPEVQKRMKDYAETGRLPWADEGR